MKRSNLPRITMSSRPAGLNFRAPPTALQKWDRSIGLAQKKAPTEISILSPIGPEEWGMVSAKGVKAQLDAIGSGPIKVLLNSPGGDAFDGIAIYNMLREHKGSVTVNILGIAASAASVIAMAGDRIEMGEATQIMIHSAAGMVAGNAEDLRQFIQLLDSIDQSAAELYARRTGLSVQEVLKMMKAETYMTAKEALAKGFADFIVADPNGSKKKPSSSMRTDPLAPGAVPLPTASGRMGAGAVTMSAFHRPGVSGSSQGTTNMTLQEKLAQLREQKAAKLARQSEIHTLMQTDRDSVTVEMRSEFSSIDSELTTLDDEILMTQFELRMQTEARPVTTTSRPNMLVTQRGPMILMKGKDVDEKFPGQNFTRKIIANALAYAEMQQGRLVSPADIAEHRWGRTNPTLVNLIRMAAVPGHGSGSGEAGSELVTADNRYTGDFIEYLYGMTVFDRLPLMEVPANVTIKGSDGAATGFWVGESKGIPVTNGSASAVSLTPLKVAAIAVASNELLADAQPSAELWIRNMLVEALAQRTDTTFLSASAASAGVSPAGILNGLVAGTSAGTSADNARTDLEALAQNFINNKNARNLWVVTSPGLGLALKLMKNALGQPEFDGVTLEGGTIEGFRLLFGDNVGSGDVIMLKPDEIWKIGDSGLQVSFSRDATIEQDTAPAGATDTPTAAANNMTSMFQEESTAIKVVRRINFQKRRSHAVAYIGDAGYGGVAS